MFRGERISDFARASAAAKVCGVGVASWCRHNSSRYNAAMRVTVFGSSGLLGQDLVRELKGEQLTALSSVDADLRDPARVGDVIHSSHPDWIILAAAYTDVDGCESHRDLAFAVNFEV